MLWPACVVFMQRRTLLTFCLMLMASALITRLALTVLNPELAEAAAYKFTIARWDALAVGALIALIARERSWFANTLKLIPVMLYGGLAYICVFALLKKNYTAVGEGAWFNQTAAAVFFAALLFRVVQPAVGGWGIWRRVLTSAPLRATGKYSYAIYVVHMPMIFTLAPVWRSHTAIFAQSFPMVATTGLAVMVFVCSYAVALCSWYFLERPCLRLRRFFVNEKAVATTQ